MKIVSGSRDISAIEYPSDGVKERRYKDRDILLVILSLLLENNSYVSALIPVNKESKA